MCKNHEYCYIDVPKKDNKTLTYNAGGNSMKVAFIIYPKKESLLEKIDTCHSNPESSYSLFTHCTFDTTKNKLDYYRGKDCMKSFCKDLKKPAAEIINNEEKRNDTTNN